MSHPLERYQKLQLKESLEKMYRYPIACEELSFILRLAYNKVPKNLQALIFQDTLSAFRLLPEMQSSSAISAAHLLLKSVENALPKQKRNLAVKEFKHAKIAQKRRHKAREKEMGSFQLPQDVLVHIFSFLDLQTLVTATLVCWLWNLASMDNHLWQLQYSVFFGDFNSKIKINQTRKMMQEGHEPSEEESDSVAAIDWRRAFRKEYVGSSSKSLRYNRGYCRHCNSIFWRKSLRCPDDNQQIKLISPTQVVDYVLDDSLEDVSSSGSDSETDEASASRLWAYPRWTDK